MNRKPLTLVLLLLVGILVMTGCNFLNTLPGNNPITSKGSVKVAIAVPSQFLTDVSQQFISHTITLSELTVKISKGSTVLTKFAPIASNVEVAFDSLEAGTWNVEVVVKDTEGYAVYKGNSTANITANTVTSTSINLALQNGDIAVNVAFSPDMGVASGEVTLINPATLEQFSQALAISGSAGTVNFGQLKATTWKLRVKLYNNLGAVLSEGETPVDVLPSRAMSASVSFLSGSLQIIVNWEEVPQVPMSIGARVVGKNMYISWEMSPSSYIAGYMLYKSTSPTGPMEYLSNELVYGYSFVDEQIAEGQTYYYWVQAYNINGASSDLLPAQGVFVSERSKILAEGIESGADVFWMNTDGTNIENLTFEPGEQMCASLSPDGMYLAYYTYDPTNSEVYVKNLATGVVTNVSNSPSSNETRPVFSPDGTQVMYSSDISGMIDLWIANLDGSAAYCIANTPDYNEDFASFSPDGSKIMFMSQVGSYWYLYTMNVYGGDVYQIPTPANLTIREAVWSPDSSKIVFSGVIVDQYGNWGDTDELWSINADGSYLTFLDAYRSDPCTPSFSADSQMVVYGCDDNYDYQWDLFIINTNGTGKTQIPELNSYVEGPTFTPDGRIVFAGQSDTDFTIDIFVVGMDGSGYLNLTPNTTFSDLRYPKWYNF